MAEKKTTRKVTPKAEVIEPKAEIKFILHKTYKVEALEGAKHLIAGRIYEVSGVIAQELVKKGFVKAV
jgi:hypothetical protein